MRAPKIQPTTLAARRRGGRRLDRGLAFGIGLMLRRKSARSSRTRPPTSCATTTPQWLSRPGRLTNAQQLLASTEAAGSSHDGRGDRRRREREPMGGSLARAGHEPLTRSAPPLSCWFGRRFCGAEIQRRPKFFARNLLTLSSSHLSRPPSGALPGSGSDRRTRFEIPVSMLLRGGCGYG
jgi:hypothetical protein